MLNLSRLKSSMIRAAIALTLVILIISLNVMTPAQAAAGDLDLTFGSGGKVTTDFDGHGDDAFAVAILPNGKILAAGSASINSTGLDFALARYNNNGSLDSSFGAGGKVTTDFGISVDQATAIAIQPDGKIVLAGLTLSASANIDFALARYNSDGSLDTTFGSGGKVTTDFSNGQDIAFGVAIQSDGKIVAAGQDFNLITGSSNFGLARYNSDGSLDTSFGAGGKVSTDFGGFDIARGLVIQTDGRIVAAGTGGDGLNVGFSLARYNSDGSLDTSFGAGGKVIALSEATARAIALLADGKFIVAGELFFNNNIDFAVARFNSDGSLDTSFGAGGKVTTDFGGTQDVGLAVAIQPDGHIVVGGEVSANLTSTAGLARYNSDGSPDTAFGSGGKLTTDFGASSFFQGLAIESTGKIIAAGRVNDSNLADFALARYGDADFDICLQDDGNGNIFQFNTRTGNYRFSNCRKGLSLTGSGSVTIRFCKVELQDVERDRNISVLANTCTHAATASVRDFSRNQTFTISDSDITNNTCSCR